jgi:ubiquinone/menaquinone biosynthesis C-methylase UbiE
MEVVEAIKLIKPGIIAGRKSSWADLGCGDGLFTLALSEILGVGSTIYAVDEKRGALAKVSTIPGIDLKRLLGNFEKDDLFLSDLDGILMANSLHFVKDKSRFIQKAARWMKDNGCFIIVEYDMDKSNRWVPFPISFDSCKKLLSGLGFSMQRIGERVSLYNNQGIYAAKVNPPTP